MWVFGGCGAGPGQMDLFDAICARGKAVQGPGANTVANQPQGGEADVGGHPSYLAVAAFLDGELDPASGNILAKPDRWLPFPDLGLGHYLGLCRQGWAVFEQNSLAQAIQGGLIDVSFNLGPIDLWHFV